MPSLMLVPAAVSEELKQTDTETKLTLYISFDEADSENERPTMIKVEKICFLEVDPRKQEES